MMADEKVSTGRMRIRSRLLDGCRVRLHYNHDGAAARIAVGADLRKDAVTRLMGIPDADEIGPDAWYTATEAFAVLYSEWMRLAYAADSSIDWTLRLDQVDRLLCERGSLSECPNAREFLIELAELVDRKRDQELL